MHRYAARAEPAAQTLIGWKFLGETLNPTMVIGLALIIGGVVTLELGRTH